MTKAKKPLPERPEPQDIAAVTISADQAAALLGRSRAWVFNLVKEGFIEKQAKGQYTLAAIAKGVTKYYEDQLATTSKTAIASRATDARAREIELRIAEKTRSLIPIEDANLALDLVVGEVNRQFTGLAARVTRDVATRRKIEAAVYEAKREISEALGSGKELARTGVDPADADTA